jgi:hypothetical protein
VVVRRRRNVFLVEVVVVRKKSGFGCGGGLDSQKGQKSWLLFGSGRARGRLLIYFLASRGEGVLG